MGNNLAWTPSSLNFGTVPVSSPVTRQIGLKASGTTNPSVGWDWVITGPNAGDFTPTNKSGVEVVDDPYSFYGVVFTPSSLGAKSATLTITSADANNTPIVIPLSGTGGVGGYLTLTPQTTNDFGVQKDGTTSSVLNVLVQNYSGADVIVTAIAFNGDFSAGGGLPGLPFTQHANAADAAKVIPVVFTPTLTGFHVTANAVEVTSNASNNPTDQAMEGTGVVINPAYSLPFLPEAVLAAFVASGVVRILRMDATNLNCEEPASFKRMYDWATPLIEKYLGRVIVRYEDESSVSFNIKCTARLTRTPLTTTDALTAQGGANDGYVHNLFFDLQVSDDLIQIEISRAANDGPLTITEIFHELEPRGEFIP